MTSILENSRKSSSYVAPAQMFLRIMGMVTTIILARYLTVDDYGIYNLFIGSILVFNFFTNFGLAGSLQRFLSEYTRLGKNGRFFRTFFVSIGYRTVSGVVFFILAWLLFDRVSGFFGVSQYKLSFTLFCLGTYALFQIDYLVLVFNSLFLHKYSALSHLTYQAFRLMLITISLMLLRGGLPGVFASEFVAYGFGAILFWFLFIRKVYAPRRESVKGDRERIEWKRFLRFSAYNAATIPGGFLFSHAMDYFVVAAMATTNQLGIYALGSRASTMLMSIMPQSLLQTVIRPAFYHRYYSVDDKNDELNRMFRSLVVLIAVVLLPTLVLVGIQAEQILTYVFKSKFAESTPVFLMLIAFNGFCILELPSDLVLQAIEKVQARLYAQVFAVYNIVAAILLMSRFGFLGVAFATGSALAGKSLFWFFMAHRYTGITLPVAALLKIVVNTAVAAVIVLWIGGFGLSFLWTFISLASGFLAYLALSYINPCFSDREKELINRFCKRRVFNV